jgi:hypothetical protein
MGYQVCDENGAVVRDVAAAYRWHVMSPEALETELTVAGFEVRHGSSGLIRPPAQPGGRRNSRGLQAYK